MDDIIVLILTLLFIIAGVFGQMKKRAAEARRDAGNGNHEEESRHGDFWERIHDEWEEPKQEPVIKKQNVYGNIEQDYLFKAEDEGQRVFTSIIKRKEPLQVITKPSKRKKFPLKKAVIYSEILHRKYF